MDVPKAEEVSTVVESIASYKASYVTGTSFFVNGGRTLYTSFSIGSEHDAKLHSGSGDK
jgi:glucose 1-dehydrogenase